MHVYMLITIFDIENIDTLDVTYIKSQCYAKDSAIHFRNIRKVHSLYVEILVFLIEMNEQSWEVEQN